MNSFPRFIGVLAVWIIALAGLYYVTANGDGDVRSSLEDSIISFFAMGEPFDARTTSGSGHLLLRH
jgi:hypothetical protein